MHPIEHLRYVARAGEVDPVMLAEEAVRALCSLSYDERALVPASRRLLEAHPSAGPLWWSIAKLLVADDLYDGARRVIDELASDPTEDELAAAFSSDLVLVSGLGETALGAIAMRPDIEVRLVGRRRRLRSLLRRLETSANIETYDEDELDDAVSDAQLVLIEVLAAGESGFLLDALDARLCESAARHGVEVWAVVAGGRLLPEALFRTVLAVAAPADGITQDENDSFDADDYDDWTASSRPSSSVLVSSDVARWVIGPTGAAAPSAALKRAVCPAPIELLSMGAGR
jgi:hypothetical protein